MRQLFALILVFCVIFSLSSGIMILIGRHQPLPNHLGVLQLTDCTPPCWIGIVPGVTALREAISRIKAHYANLPNYQIAFSESPTTFTVRASNQKDAADHLTVVVHTYDDTRVSTIGFDTSSDQGAPNVGELYGILGQPTSILVSTSNRGPQKYDLAFSTEDCISAETQLFADNYVNMFHRLGSFYFGESGRCSAQDKQLPWRSWHGFQSFDRYSH